MIAFLSFLLPAILWSQPLQTSATEQWRPLYHFTPAKNWTNDPNGLIYMNGLYHLYNQQNPFGNSWGHMSWGHATSTDLVHWQHLPVAIPEIIRGSDTVWRFSGSAVNDKDNTSGLCKNKDCIIAVYTAHQPNIHKESQYISYSNDGGNTFIDFEKNPVIDLNKQDFRDPNVFWYEPGKFWLMTVVLPAEHKALFYRSANLKEWALLSEFGPQGYTGAYWECPFLLQLPVEGTNEKKWILVISAAGGEKGVFEQYFIGDFDGREFKNQNKPDSVLTLDYGDSFYAAIPWNGTIGTEKLFIGWMIPNPQPTFPWRGQMSVARSLNLRRTGNDLRLIQQPAPSVRNVLASNKSVTKTEIKELVLTNEEKQLPKISSNGNAYWITVYITVKGETNAGFKITQEKDPAGNIIEETVISYQAKDQELVIDRTKAGGQLNEKALRRTIPLRAIQGTLQLEILLDKSSLEVFANNGEAVFSTYVHPGKDANGISLFARNGQAEFKNLNIADMSAVK